MGEIPQKPTYPDHMEKAPAGLFEHYCMHEGGDRSGLKSATGKHGIVASISGMVRSKGVSGLYRYQLPAQPQ